MPGDRDEDAELHPPGAAAARFTSPFGVPLMVKNFDRVAKKHGRDFGKGLGLFAGGVIPARAKMAAFGGELVTDPISGRDHLQVKQGLYRPRPDKITAASAAWLANTNKSGCSANCRIVVQNRNPFSATLPPVHRVSIPCPKEEGATTAGVEPIKPKALLRRATAAKEENTPTRMGHSRAPRAEMQAHTAQHLGNRGPTLRVSVCVKKGTMWQSGLMICRTALHAQPGNMGIVLVRAAGTVGKGPIQKLRQAHLAPTVLLGNTEGKTPREIRSLLARVVQHTLLRTMRVPTLSASASASKVLPVMFRQAQLPDTWTVVPVRSCAWLARPVLSRSITTRHGPMSGSADAKAHFTGIPQNLAMSTAIRVPPTR